MTVWEEYVNTMKNSVTEKLTNRSEESNQEKQTTTTTDCGTKCPLCNDTGWMFTDYNTVKECECGIRQRQIQESRLRFASIPETYMDVTFKDITAKYYTKPESKEKIKDVVENVKWYLERLDENIESGKGIYFWSQTKGSGKTMLAAALANELINNYKRFCKFATSLDILDEIRATYNDKSENTESRLLEDLVSTPFLVIDDFGTERVTDWVGEKFYQIVNKRYINKKVTFFTSNYDLKSLKYDERITSRIRERTYIVHFPEESVREFLARQGERV